MPIPADELARRLEEGARARVLLRRATRELAEMGRHVLDERRRGSRRPDPQRPPVR